MEIFKKKENSQKARAHLAVLKAYEEGKSWKPVKEICFGLQNPGHSCQNHKQGKCKQKGRQSRAGYFVASETGLQNFGSLSSRTSTINPAKATLKSDMEKWNNYFLTSVPGKIMEQVLLDTMCLSTWKIIRWLVTATMASLKANHTWEIWRPSTMGLQQQQMREEHRTLHTWTCAKQVTLSCRTASSVRWRDVDLMDGPFTDKIWLDGSTQELWWTAQYPTESSEEWCSSGGGTKMEIFNIFTSVRTESILSKLAADTNLCGAVDKLEGREAIQRVPDRL